MSMRMRSPSYPSNPLGQSIELAEKLFRSERTNSVDREVAALAMGYSGITGQSAKILSNLIQFGLLEKSGKNEVRVSRRALSILHPDDPEEKRNALREAAEDPELFQRIRERFPDGLPSESALRSLLLKEGFTDAAIPPAVRSFMDSYEYLQNAGVCDRHGRWLSAGAESQSEQLVEDEAMDADYTPSKVAAPVAPQTTVGSRPSNATKPTYFFDGEKIDLGGSVLDQDQAEKVIQFMTAIKSMLPKKIDPAEPTEH